MQWWGPNTSNLAGGVARLRASMMTILSIQSSVAYGHVGNWAAVFPLQLLGFEVWPVPTVQFSNHPGHGRFQGRITPAGEVAALIGGLDRLGVLAGCDAVLSGYLGEAATGAAVAEAVGRVKAARPGALYCCDPVIGDHGPGVFVAAGVPEMLAATLLPLADVLTPNQFELERLSGRPVASLAEAVAAAQALRARGPGVVAVTSLRVAELAGDRIGCLSVGPDGAHLVETPLLALTAHGAGDAFAALLLGHLLNGMPAGQANAAALSALFGVLLATLAAGGGELALVAARSELTAPSRRFAAQLLPL